MKKLLSILILSIVTNAIADSRTWTSSDGRKMEAVLIQYHESTSEVTMHLTSGRRMTFPINLLSEGDQTFILEQFSKEPETSDAEQESSTDDSTTDEYPIIQTSVLNPEKHGLRENSFKEWISIADAQNEMNYFYDKGKVLPIFAEQKKSKIRNLYIPWTDKPPYYSFSLTQSQLINLHKSQIRRGFELATINQVREDRYWVSWVPRNTVSKVLPIMERLGISPAYIFLDSRSKHRVSDPLNPYKNLSKLAKRARLQANIDDLGIFGRMFYLS